MRGLSVPVAGLPGDLLLAGSAQRFLEPRACSAVTTGHSHMALCWEGATKDTAVGTPPGPSHTTPLVHRPRLPVVAGVRLGQSPRWSLGHVLKTTRRTLHGPCRPGPGLPGPLLPIHQGRGSPHPLPPAVSRTGRAECWAGVQSGKSLQVMTTLVLKNGPFMGGAREDTGREGSAALLGSLRL